jgi:uncharacterized protein involved in exopolysaccharide biosynthesis
MTVRGSTHGCPENKDLSSRGPGGGSAEVSADSLTDVVPGRTASQFEINFFELGQLLVRQRKWIFGIVIPVVFLVALKMFATPNVYQSHAIILPTGIKEDVAALEGLVGLSGAGSAPQENSSIFYPLILQSDLIKDSVLNQVYDITFKGKPMRVTLAEYFGKDDPNRLRKSLGDATMVSATKLTREIHTSVETKYPELSRAILSEYLEQLENYNRFTRKSSAKENQRYLEQRLEQAGRELAETEERLKEFREANGNWANSTDAVILRDLLRLQRDQEMKSNSYLFLEKQLEMARFDAQKDIPIVRVLDQPSLPTIKSGPKRMITIFFSGVIAFALVAVGIIISDLWRQGTTGKNRGSYSSFRQDFSRAFPRSIRVLNLVRRVSRGRIRQLSEKVEV